MKLANRKEFRSKNKVNKLMVGRVEEVRKETKDVWKRFLKNNRVPINDDESQKDDTSHPIVQTHSALETVDSQNPLVDHPKTMEMKGEVAQETPKVDTTPSGDTDAQGKDKEVLTQQQPNARKGEAEKDKSQDKVQEKGEQKIDNVSVVTEIDTPKDKGKRIL